MGKVASKVVQATPETAKFLADKLRSFLRKINQPDDSVKILDNGMVDYSDDLIEPLNKAGMGDVRKEVADYNSIIDPEYRASFSSSPIYAGTFEKSSEIIPYGQTIDSNGVYRPNLFGGIFGNSSEEVAESHGDIIQELYTQNHIDSKDFNRAVFFDGDLSSKAYANFRDILEQHKNPNKITDGEIEELLSYTMGEKHIEDFSGDAYFEPDMGIDRFNEIMGTNLSPEDGFSLSDAGWDFQGLKGELARRMGFDSVGMVDEHGESALVLNGRLANAAFDPAKKNSSNLLGAATPEALTALATTASAIGISVPLLQQYQSDLKTAEESGDTELMLKILEDLDRKSLINQTPIERSKLANQVVVKDGARVPGSPTKDTIKHTPFSTQDEAIKLIGKSGLLDETPVMALLPDPRGLLSLGRDALRGDIQEGAGISRAALGGVDFVPDVAWPYLTKAAPFAIMGLGMTSDTPAQNRFRNFQLGEQ